MIRLDLSRPALYNPGIGTVLLQLGEYRGT